MFWTKIISLYFGHVAFENIFVVYVNCFFSILAKFKTFNFNSVQLVEL